jgi:hypothetical protein
MRKRASTVGFLLNTGTWICIEHHAMRMQAHHSPTNPLFFRRKAPWKSLSSEDTIAQDVAYNITHEVCDWVTSRHELVDII